ncbi:hypothetical protein [Parabacteroides timonensis]|uniref:hypothetical protein n=1 Tax=Parabacteroides timonensis TaxID=1871013 RepID=UPI0011150B5D|nr:hypothetical protein [Parabacteroides timonensis]
MKKSRLFFLLCTFLILFSCSGSDDDKFSLKDEAYTYKVVFEVIGTDYMAEAHVLNTDNVPLYDATDNKNLKQASINEEFVGKKVYYTTDKVQMFSSQGIILSKSGATLTMTVYEDNKEVYKNTVSVPDGKNTVKDLHYYKNNVE